MSNTHRATGTFKNTSYVPTARGDAKSVALGRIAIERAFAGDLQGVSTAELLTCQSPMATGYVGCDRFVGMLAGRRGSFVFQHTGILEAGKLTPAGYIVPGSGTDELAGIRGAAIIAVTPEGEHSLTLEYTFDSEATETG